MWTTKETERGERPDNDIQCEECPQSMAIKRELTQHKIVYHTKLKVKKSKKVKTGNNIFWPLFLIFKETVFEGINKSMNHLIFILSPHETGNSSKHWTHETSKEKN